MLIVSVYKECLWSALLILHNVFTVMGNLVYYVHGTRFWLIHKTTGDIFKYLTQYAEIMVGFVVGVRQERCNFQNSPSEIFL